MKTIFDHIRPKKIHDNLTSVIYVKYSHNIPHMPRLFNYREQPSGEVVYEVVYGFLDMWRTTQNIQL